MVNISDRDTLSNCFTISQVLVKVVYDQSMCAAPYGSKRTDAFLFCRWDEKMLKST